MKIEVLAQKRNSPACPGAIVDNYSNPLFITKLESLFNGRRFSLVDFGCAGGLFVGHCLQNGHFAIGIDGVDFNLRSQSASWKKLPDRFFVADITEPIQILVNGCRTLVDVITAWEVLAHIKEEQLDGVFDNIKTHLKPDGMFIASISAGEEYLYQKTSKPKSWWLDKFAGYGFTNQVSLVRYFKDDWVRGPLQDAHDSFNIVLKRTES